ncbi:MAG: ATP-binding protein [Deltaproteobacteria bacterium]|nr:ATP-binding protein [Deltaproteobacteria bacterium]
MREFRRLVEVPGRSFFLFGPRGVGKSFWLRRALESRRVFDLLDTRLQLEFARAPYLLEARIGEVEPGAWIWLDEVQKVPALLDEVHRLMETRGLRFALSGSSARKLLRQGADLLAGRAITRRMEPLCSRELADAFDVRASLEWGCLPLVVGDPSNARDILTSYVHTYIREEVREEGLVRKIEPFLRFLEVAGMMNGRVLNAENVARDAQVPRRSVVSYFEILEGTLMGHRLPAWQPRIAVREVAHPKFYWFDPGVARAAAGMAFEAADPSWLGFSLETLVFHELRVHNHVAARECRIAYYRTRAGAEVDFVIESRRGTGDRKPQVVLVETKLAKRWDRSWESAMRHVAASGKVEVAGMYGVYLGESSYRFDDVKVLPVREFLDAVHGDRVF